MLLDLKPRLHSDAIKELIGYTVFPDPDRIEQAVNMYSCNNNFELFGYEFEGNVIGIIGFQMDLDHKLGITHIAVHPEYRGMGYGRGLILELIHLKKPIEIMAETDEEAVEFYRSIGFTIESLGKKYPGTERYRCIYKTDSDH